MHLGWGEQISHQIFQAGTVYVAYFYSAVSYLLSRVSKKRILIMGLKRRYLLLAPLVAMIYRVGDYKVG